MYIPHNLGYHRKTSWLSNTISKKLVLLLFPLHMPTTFENKYFTVFYRFEILND